MRGWRRDCDDVRLPLARRSPSGGMAMSAATDLFVEEAKGVSIDAGLHHLAIPGLRRGTHEWTGPCPQGRSTTTRGRPNGFAVHPTKGWKCRPCGVGGRDAIGLAAHALALDVTRRGDFLAACAAVLGRAVPGDDESEADRAERQARVERQRRENEDKAKKQAETSARKREEERAKARGKWEAGTPGAIARAYLAKRLGVSPSDIEAPSFLRDRADESYWHGTDDLDRPMELYRGPAMVAPFVDAGGLVIGCHLTWIDLRRAPKFRPDLGRDEDGDPLPTKKMRGSKAGGLIPLYGFVQAGGLIVPSSLAIRLVSGEGIENTVAIAVAEGFRADTLYAAAGDLGNLAGPVDATSNFPHPTLTKTGKNDRVLPVRVAGPVPKAVQGADDAMPVPDAIEDVLLVADGDSEPIWTASTMARAEARIVRAGRRVGTIWPSAGTDFASMFQDQK